MPTVFSFFPIFRNIVIREQIQIVHGHASLSSFCHEAILHARTMGLRTVFTDHSLFGFADAASILTNKLLKFALSDVDHVICVSHTWYVEPWNGLAERLLNDHTAKKTQFCERLWIPSWYLLSPTLLLEKTSVHYLTLRVNVARELFRNHDLRRESTAPMIPSPSWSSHDFFTIRVSIFL